MTIDHSALAIDRGSREVTAAQPHAPWPAYRPSAHQALESHLASGAPLSIADGTGIIARLEHRLADVLGLTNVLTTSSGTAALHSAYLALDLPPGSEVICPVLTFHASVSPAIHCGLTPVLVDVDPATGNLAPEAVLAAITPKTSCVVVNHLWGTPADLDAIHEICEPRGIRIIEDCSHAYLSRYRGRPVGTTGDIAVFSMQASKALSAGEGGFLATADRSLFERACLAGHYRGRSLTQITDPALARFADTGLGLKYRLHPLAAVIAHHEAGLLEDYARVRNRHADRLTEALSGLAGMEPPKKPTWATAGAIFGYKPAYVPGHLERDGKPVDCDTFIEILSAEGLEIHRPSVRPLHEMPLFHEAPPMASAQATWRPRLARPFEGCDEYFRNRLSLPVFSGEHDDAIVDQYAQAFRKVAAALAPSAGGA